MTTDQFIISRRSDTSSVWHPPSETKGKALASSFVKASPFPHLIIDNLFDADFLSKVAEEIKTLPSADWAPHYTALQKKRMTSNAGDLPPLAAHYFEVINSPDFIFFLQSVTGIMSLQPDLTLFGGGVHEAGADGHFEIHVDFQRHPSTGLENRIAVITYLNANWTEFDGGALELWNMNENRAEISILPLLGRTVIMGQSPIAAHGYPTSLPGDRPRRALIAYFYTEPEHPAETAADTTLYIRRPGMPLSRRIQMTIRDVFPQPVIRSLRNLQSQLVHKRTI